MQKLSFKSLVNDYGAAVLNAAVRILRDSEKAQDVYQDVFLEMWRRWHKCDGDTNWGAYLYRMTVRKSLEAARKPVMESLSEAHAEYPGASERADRHLKAQELQERIVECLARLPKRQAEVFVLSKIEGLKHEETARILGCSPETVRVHLYRAVRKMADELRDYLNED